MANLIQYAQIKIYANGSLLVEEASVTMKRSSNAQMIKTVAKGFAGVSKGAPMTTVQISSAVPSAGYELDPTVYINSNNIIQFTLVLGEGLQATMNGFITDDDSTHAVDTPSKLDISFVTGPVVWEQI